MLTPIRLIIAVFFMSLISTSCNKYSEGPVISLRTKKARLTQKWEFVSGTHSYAGFAEAYSFEFDKNGEFIIELEKDTTSTQFFTGTWEFGSKKGTVITYLPSIEYRRLTFLDVYEELNITRLKIDEFWFQESSEEVRLVPSN